MFDLNATELAQAGAVGVAIAIVFVGGFVVYKLGRLLIEGATEILTNHLHELTDEFRGLRHDVSEGLTRIEVGLERASVRDAQPPAPHRPVTNLAPGWEDPEEPPADKPPRAE